MVIIGSASFDGGERTRIMSREKAHLAYSLSDGILIPIELEKHKI